MQELGALHPRVFAGTPNLIPVARAGRWWRIEPYCYPPGAEEVGRGRRRASPTSEGPIKAGGCRISPPPAKIGDGVQSSVRGAAGRAGHTRRVFRAGGPRTLQVCLLEWGARLSEKRWSRVPGLRVLYGRATALEAAPAYLSISEALRDYVNAGPAETLRLQLGQAAPEVALLLPSKRDRFTGVVMVNYRAWAARTSAASTSTGGRNALTIARSLNPQRWDQHRHVHSRGTVVL
jgi:hypothetical protein